MKEPSDFEKQIADELAAMEPEPKHHMMYSPERKATADDILQAAKRRQLQDMLDELMRSRLRIEYLGQSSITGGREERID